MSKPLRKSDVDGKTVIDSSGKVAGKVKDLTFTLRGVITLIVERPDGTEVPVLLSNVTGVSEYVAVRSERDALVPTPGETSPRGMERGATCKFCGHALDPESAWCPGCGKAHH